MNGPRNTKGRMDLYERELRASEARFRNIIDRNADGILIVDVDGMVRFANPVAGRIFGREAEALVGEAFGFPVVAGEKAEVDLIGEGGQPITADMRVTETHWEGEPCHLVSLRDITERKQAEERIAHLNNVLRALRNVGQLIVREKDRDRLLQGACETLVETRGYYNAWILLVDRDGDPLTVAEAGLGESFLPLLRRLERGDTSYCIRQALGQPGALAIENPFQTCADCPLAESYGDRGALSARLEHSGEVYGVLTVSTPKAFVADEGEHALFEEMVDDLALALRNMTLERRREELERIVNRSPAVAFLWRAEEGWPVEYVSDNVKQFGYDPDDFYSGRFDFADVVHPDDVDRVVEEVTRANRSQSKQFTQEYRVISASGEVRWVDDRTWIRHDAEGRTTHYEGIILDITERKRMEEAIRESEQKLDSMLQTMRDGMVFVNSEGEITYANAAAERILEVHRDGILGRYYHEREWRQIDERGEPYPADQLPLSIALGGSRAVEGLEHGIVAPNGETKWLSVNAAPMVDQRGRPHGAVASFRDVTEQKRMEEALRHSEQRYRTLFEHAGDAIFVHDLEGRFLDVNRIACERLGYSREELLQMTPSDIDAPAYAPLIPKRIARIKEEGRAVFETAHVTKDGRTIPIELSSRVIHYEGKPVILSIARDVTERKAAEEKIERYAAELERSNQELEQFGYVISHDLREPLRVVSSYLRLLVRRYGDQLDAKADTYINFAVEGAERMQEMIRALLNLSRVETHGQAFKATDVEEVVERTLRALGRAIEESGAEVTHDPLPTVMADRAQLGQVFQNLIANAIKFRREDEPPRVHVSAEREGDAWAFSVADNGIGIEPRHAERVFQIFQRLHTEDEYPGLGLGLALCKRIVERHGGRIWLTSEPGEGATFTFTLPA